MTKTNKGYFGKKRLTIEKIFWKKGLKNKLNPGFYCNLPRSGGICREMKRKKTVELLRKQGESGRFFEIIFVENVHFNFESEVVL